MKNHEKINEIKDSILDFYKIKEEDFLVLREKDQYQKLGRYSFIV